MAAPCPAWAFAWPGSHDCSLTKGHEGPHICDCGTEWEDR